MEPALVPDGPQSGEMPPVAAVVAKYQPGESMAEP
jgi:hypothetical protein